MGVRPLVNTRSKGNYSSSSLFCDQTDLRAARLSLPPLLLFFLPNLSDQNFETAVLISIVERSNILPLGMTRPCKSLEKMVISYEICLVFAYSICYWEVVLLFARNFPLRHWERRISRKNFSRRKNFRHVLKKRLEIKEKNNFFQKKVGYK